MTELLKNFVAGRWIAAPAGTLRDPVTGADLVRVSRDGLDLGSLQPRPQRRARAAGNDLCHLRAARLARSSRYCRPTATPTTTSPPPIQGPRKTTRRSTSTAPSSLSGNTLAGEQHSAIITCWQTAPRKTGQRAPLPASIC